MTTATEYSLKAEVTQQLNWLLMPTPGSHQDTHCSFRGVTRQEVLNELHDRAILTYAASSQGLDDLVVALGHALTGRLATFAGVKLIRTLGVLADQADAQDWAELAEVKLTREAVVGALYELALRP